MYLYILWRSVRSSPAQVADEQLKLGKVAVLEQRVAHPQKRKGRHPPVRNVFAPFRTTPPSPPLAVPHHLLERHRVAAV